MHYDFKPINLGKHENNLLLFIFNANLATIFIQNKKKQNIFI